MAAAACGAAGALLKQPVGVGGAGGLVAGAAGAGTEVSFILDWT